MKSLTRRDFLAASALAAGRGGSARADEPAPRRTGPVGANDKVVLGFIGVGGMGTGLLNIFKGFPDVEVAAVCDVYEPHLLRAKSRRREAVDAQGLPPGPRPQGHRRRRGRHARPLARHPDDPGLPGGQGRLLREAAGLPDRRGPRHGRRPPRRHKRVTQMGNLIHAGENYHRVVEIVRSGVLGPITKARVWIGTARGGLGTPADGPAPGRRLRLLARPGPEAAVQPEPLHLQLAVLLGLRRRHPHRLLLPHRRPGPLGDGGRCPRDDRRHRRPLRPATTTPRRPTRWRSSTTTQRKGFDLVWSQTDASSHGLEGKGHGIMFQGTEATLVADYNSHQIFPEAGQDDRAPARASPDRSGTTASGSTRSRRASSARATSSTAIASPPSATWATSPSGPARGSAGTPRRSAITNHEEANRHLAREEYRAPWTLPEV